MPVGVPLGVMAFGLGLSHAEPWEAGFHYQADLLGVVSGGSAHRARYVGEFGLVLDGDLDQAFGWHGATVHVDILHNAGDQPNEDAGTLQGIDSIEVSDAGLRLYEAWIQQDFGGLSVLAGIYDLNDEFSVTDSAGLLVASPFGIATDFAATGAAGPSLFPSTALALRLNYDVEGAGYVRVAAFNANAGTWGDKGGLDVSFDDGALLIGEAGVDVGLRIAGGYWRYAQRQDDIRAGAGRPRVSQGGYVLTEAPLGDQTGRFATRLFARVSISDGNTTDFVGGWQAGALVTGVLAGRPESAFSLGINQALLSDGGRANLRDAGIDPAHAETTLEVTYSDKILDHLALQPDLQVILTPGGDRDAKPAVVAGLRLTFDYAVLGN